MPQHNPRDKDHPTAWHPGSAILSDMSDMSDVSDESDGAEDT